MKNAYQMPLVFRRELFRGLFFAGLLMSGCATAQSDIETDFEDRSAKLAEIAATRSALVAQVRELAQLERELLTAQGNERVIFNEISRSGEVVPGIDSLPVSVHVERITSAELQQPTPKLGVLLAGAGDNLRVVGVTPGGGAKAAGVIAGDRLISVNGFRLNAENSVADSLREVASGDAVHLELERNGETITYDVVTSDQVDGLSHLFDSHPLLADLNIDVDHLLTDLEAVEQKVLFISDTDAVQDFTRAFSMPGLFALGGASEMISNHEGLANYFGTADGVVVLKVVRDNTLGLHDGDVVLSVAGQAVSRPVDLGRAMLALSPGEPVSIDVMRNYSLTTITGEVPEAHFPLPSRPAKPL